MNARFRRALAPLVLVGAHAPAACGRGDHGGSGDFKIAIVTRNFTNPHWAALRDGAIAEAAELGVKVTVRAGGSETDADGENAQISTMAAQGFGCFGVVPVNDTNVITPLTAVARDAGIFSTATESAAAASGSSEGAS